MGVFFFIVLVLGLASKGYTEELYDYPTLRFYYSSLDNFTELPLEEASNIFHHPWYNKDRDTVFYTFGFTGHPKGLATIEVIKAYLKQNVNLALLNWENLAARVKPSLQNSYFNWAVPNSKLIASQFADALEDLSKWGLDLKKTKLVGHSLGAHLFGLAGNKLAKSGIAIPCIIGLDPASYGFQNKAPAQRLNPSSAEFVSVIHSDPSTYGFNKALGTVDFWPNFKPVGKMKQPGCDNKTNGVFSSKDLCSHHRSWELLVDALNIEGSILGSHAKNYRTWKSNSEDKRKSHVMDISKCDKNSIPGNYYFTTNPTQPFGLGNHGL